MDGVTADFFSAAIKRLNFYTGKDFKHKDFLDTPNYLMEEKYGLTRDKFWHAIDQNYFWLDLEPFYWSKDLLEMLQSIAPVTISSTPSPWNQCVSQKLDWVRRNLKLTEEDCMFGPRKYLMANPNTLLVDDLQDNVDRFIAAGGKAVCVPSNWNTKNLNFGKVAASITKYLMSLENKQ